MATRADVEFFKALQDARRNIESSQQDIVQQNQRASSGSGIGGGLGTILGILAGTVLGGPAGAAIGAGIGKGLGGEAGEQIAGGFAGGEIPKQLFFQNDTQEQNRLLDMAQQDMNTQQWTDALIQGLTTWAAGGFGGFNQAPGAETFYTGQQAGSPLTEATSGFDVDTADTLMQSMGNYDQWFQNQLP